MAKVQIKFGKELYNIEVEADETLESFQAKVYAVSTVPPKTMRLLNKGSQIKDDSAVKNIKDGSVLTLIGTKEANIMEKIEIVKQEQVAHQAKREDEDFGIVNVGNTCYMNAGLQMLRKIPELRQWFKKANLGDYGFEGCLKNISSTFKELDQKTSKPVKFVVDFLELAPEFKPLGQQQDSDEFVQKLLLFMHKAASIENQEGIKENLVSHFFEIEFQDRLTNKDLPDEPPVISYSTGFKLGCVIGGDNKVFKVSSIQEGLKYSLCDTVERTSPLDNVIHPYEKKSMISKLPKYLIVQEVRFYWKSATELDRTQKSTSTKICKAIEFGHNLDLYDFCTESLKERLDKGRQYQAKKKEENAEKDKNRFEDFKNEQKKLGRECDEREYYKEFQKLQKVQEEREYDENLYRPHGLGLETGEYNLIGVITHQGTTADSGHYMAWTHHKGNQWFKYNDDDVLPKKHEDILTLKGGLATIEMAYILLYRRKEVV